ncbi:VOC family protein [Streptomyces sp. NPDC046860]|uniref:VOC family protein n=1 Tax=Streptomyces sp. NPDC046860 TaxID=3154495 RepID=UPI0033DE99CC
MSQNTAPTINGVHHLSFTVADLDSSLGWYQKLFGADRVDHKFVHLGAEDTGYGILLVTPVSGVVIGLHTNTANKGEKFDEARTGLDHVSFQVSAREDLETWAAWLDELGIAHTGIRDETEPFAYSTLVFRDPDDIQLEFVAVG